MNYVICVLFRDSMHRKKLPLMTAAAEVSNNSNNFSVILVVCTLLFMQLTIMTN